MNPEKRIKQQKNLKFMTDNESEIHSENDKRNIKKRKINNLLEENVAVENQQD